MIHIIVPVHNRAEVTREFVAALGAQTRGDYRLLLIDDGCTDDTVAQVRLAISPERLRVVAGDGTLWWAGALQRAYEVLVIDCDAAADTILIINDDVTFGPEFLQRGIEALEEHARSAVQAMGVDRNTGFVDRGAVANLITLKFRGAVEGEQPNCLSTRGLMMTAATFLESGGFKPSRLPHYLSDYEFTLRLRRQGLTLRCSPAFCAAVRLELTGTETTESRAGLKEFVRKALSNRSKNNPKHYSAFVLLACPPWVVPFHLARIWVKFGLSALRSAIVAPFGGAAARAPLPPRPQR